MATRVAVVVELDFLHLTAPFPKFPIKRKDLADISSRNQFIAHFVPNFVAMTTKGKFD